MRRAAQIVEIHSLTSDAGQRLNGCCGIVEPSASEDPNVRLAVRIDGSAEAKSLKRSNLLYVTPAMTSFGVGVGRSTLRDQTWMATLMLGSDMIQRETGLRVLARSSGNLAMAFQAFRDRRVATSAAVALELTDLNTVRACRMLSRGEPVRLATPAHKEPLKSLAKAMRRRKEAGGRLIVAFSPHRVQPDAPAALGLRGQYGCAAERVGAVDGAAYLIYPSPHPTENDALEVRYLHAGQGGQKLKSRQERFLDYGEAETLAYARDAVALGDAARLRPLELASVDPQAFWAAVLRLEAFEAVVAELHEAQADDRALGLVLAEWRELKVGWEASRVAARYAGAERGAGASVWNYDADEWDVSSTQARRLVPPPPRRLSPPHLSPLCISTPHRNTRRLPMRARSRRSSWCRRRIPSH